MSTAQKDLRGWPGFGIRGCRRGPAVSRFSLNPSDRNMSKASHMTHLVREGAIFAPTGWPILRSSKVARH